MRHEARCGPSSVAEDGELRQDIPPPAGRSAWAAVASAGGGRSRSLRAFEPGTERRRRPARRAIPSQSPRISSRARRPREFLPSARGSGRGNGRSDSTPSTGRGGRVAAHAGLPPAAPGERAPSRRTIPRCRRPWDPIPSRCGGCRRTRRAVAPVHPRCHRRCRESRSMRPRRKSGCPAREGR